LKSCIFNSLLTGKQIFCPKKTNVTRFRSNKQMFDFVQKLIKICPFNSLQVFDPNKKANS